MDITWFSSRKAISLNNYLIDIGFVMNLLRLCDSSSIVWDNYDEYLSLKHKTLWSMAATEFIAWFSCTTCTWDWPANKKILRTAAEGRTWRAALITLNGSTAARTGPASVASRAISDASASRDGGVLGAQSVSRLLRHDILRNNYIFF